MSKIGAVTTELLDAVIVHIGDVDITGLVGGDAYGTVKLPIASTLTTPLSKISTVGSELLDAVVTSVGDVDITGLVGGDVVRIVKSPIIRTNTKAILWHICRLWCGVGAGGLKYCRQ